MNLEATLYEHFGFTSFRSGQREVITSVLDGNHTLAMLPTGSGKSLCYQLPAYMIKKTVLIVSPLLSLMQDQAEQLKMRGEKSVLTLNSFLSFQQKQQALQVMNRFRFIFLSPEMLAVDSVMNALKKVDIGLFVIDEAHCISQWGYDFRPDYLSLGLIRKQLGNPVTLALTATATKEVLKDIKDKLMLEEAVEIVSSVDRSNIAMIVEECYSYEDKLSRLKQVLQECKGSVIVYFSSKKAAESVTHYLRENGVGSVDYYHGGMEQEQRLLIQQQFLMGQLRIICATSAFGMGVNKENVRVVIHFHLSGGMESYLQEIGRAGRDGKQSAAIMLYCEGDEGLPLHLLDQQFPTEVQIVEVCKFLQFNQWNVSHLTKASEMELMERFSLNDVQWRWMKSIMMEHENEPIDVMIEQLKQLSEKRKSKNLNKLQRFFSWRVQPGCRRKGILDYFQEDLKLVNDTCCDHCGVTLDHLMANFPVSDQVKEVQEMTWRQELAAILIRKDNSNEE